MVVAETYPGEVYFHLGLPPGFGKRTQQGRTDQTPAIVNWWGRNGIELSHELARLRAGGDLDWQLGRLAGIRAERPAKALGRHCRLRAAADNKSRRPMQALQT